jgi:hypothetical protein
MPVGSRLTAKSGGPAGSFTFPDACNVADRAPG